LLPVVGNDNAVPGGIADTTALVAHPEVVQCIRAELRRRRVARQDIDDAIADVQVECIEAARTREAVYSLAQCKALATTVAVHWAVDRVREAEVRSKYDTGFCEDADAHLRPTLRWEHRDPIDTKRYLAVLKDLFESGQMPEHGEEILQGVADEVPHEVIAAAIGVSTTVVRNRLARMRSKFRARLAALGMLPLVLLVVGALIWPASPPYVSAPRTTPSADPAAPVCSVLLRDGGAPPPLSKNRPPPSDEIAPCPVNQMGDARFPRAAP
jgi:DNA-directed RNA polymerase specialized sigma24 family protein